MSNKMIQLRFGPEFPEELRTAQAAINLPEVQEMLARLAKYNLGICMPHLHTGESGTFQVLPQDTVQVESKLEVTFLPEDEARELLAIPVAWRWVESGGGDHEGENIKAAANPCAMCLVS